MQYQNTSIDTLQNIQPNAVLKINLDNPNEIYWINLDVESAAKEKYLAWLAEGNEPLPADSEQDPWAQIRSTRDQLISDSDWTMTPGATVDQAQWSAYRQKLRDLPQTYENAADVVWPTLPSASGPNTIEE